MATLEKIRSKAGLLVFIVGFALLAFILGDFFNSGSTYFRQSQEKVAEIDGKVVKIHEYQDLVDEMTDVYKSQSGTNNIPEEYQTQIRQSVFDGLVQDAVLEKATAKLGLQITPEELFDMVQGENISPVIQQMQMFANPQTGTFDKAALLRFLKVIENDSNTASMSAEQQSEIQKARSFWMFWEKNIKRQRLEEKYVTLLGKAVSANKLDAKDAFLGSAVSSNIVYAMQPYSTISDSTVTVSKSEIEKLYNQRKEMFKQKEGRVIKYVAVDIRPSKEDYDKATATIESVKKDLSTATDKIADVVNENSEVQYVDAFFTENALDDQMKQFVKTANVGDIFGPSYENDKYRLFKLVDKTVAPDSVKVSHIMLTGADDATLKSRADSIINVLKNGGDFAALAKQFSSDQAAEKGGELGWFTEATALRALNDDFKKTIFSTPVNDYSIVKSMYGTHIVKVTDKTANVNKYKIADVDMAVSASSKTYGIIYNKLNQFVTKNSDPKNLEAAAKKAGYSAFSNVTINKTDETIGNIKNSRQVIRWAFQNDKGKLSEIFECNDKFVIAAIEGKLLDGYRSLASVTPMLKAELVAQKKGEMIVKSLEEKKLTSLESYAQAMKANIDSVKFVSFATPRIAGIGVEPKLNAMVSLLKPDQVSAPVAGNNGVYVFRIVDQNKDLNGFDEAAELKALDSSNMYRVGYQAVQSLIDKAKVVDNRIRFY